MSNLGYIYEIHADRQVKMEKFNEMYEQQSEAFEKLQLENEVMHKKLATLVMLNSVPITTIQNEREANKYRAQLAKEKKGFEDILSSYESRLEIKTNKYNELQERIFFMSNLLEEARIPL